MHHSFKSLFTLSLMINTRLCVDDFVYDYFVYKSVPRVTVFSCEQTSDDFRSVKKMNELGISVSIAHPEAESYNVSEHIFRKDYWLVGILLDTRCQRPEVNEKIITQTASYHLYDGIHIWLIVGSNFQETRKLLNDSSYSPLTDLVMAVETDEGYELHDVYNPSKSHGGALNITQFGFWDSTSGLHVTQKQDKFSRRANLHGLKVKIGAVVKHQRPGVAIEDHLRDNVRKSEDVLTKYAYAIILHLADLYNFTIDITTFSEWAAMVNGTEEGMMVELSKSKLDIGSSLCSANVRFASYGHLTMPGYPYRTFFILRSDIARLKWTELVTPFAVDSWYAIGAIAVLSIFVITAIQMTEYGEGWIAESGHAIFATIGVICQQGLTFVPNRLAGRVAFLFLLFFGILLLNYYSASVVSARLSDPPDKMNDSLYSLAKSHMQVASEPYFVVDDNLNSRSLVDWEVRYFNEEVWKKLPMTRYAKPEDGMKNAAKGGYAYHTSAEIAYPLVHAYWDEKGICEMTEIHLVTPRTMTFYERADSPFTEMVKIGLIKTANMGLQSRTINRWKPKTPYCSPESRSLQSISFFEIAPAVMMIGIGAILAFMVFQFEQAFYKIHPATSANARAPKMQRTGGKKALLRV